MSERNQLLVGAGIMIAIMALCIGFLWNSGPIIPDPDVYDTSGQPRVTYTEKYATIAFPDEDVTVPAPAGYCFLDPVDQTDKEMLEVMENMQVGYGNHLWLAFADCNQLKAVRSSKDLNAYINTGMLLSPANMTQEKMTSEAFTTMMRDRLGSMDPVAFEKMVNKNVHNNMSPKLDIISNQPVIISDNKEDLTFLMRHQFVDKENVTMDLTEFDIVASIKDHPLVAVFTYRDLTDPTPYKEFAANYLTSLRGSNVPAHTDEPDLQSQ